MKRVLTAGLGLALLAAVSTAPLAPAKAGGIGTGAAVGLGLGAFALGTMLGAATNPYYGPYAPYGYAPAPAYYGSPTRCTWQGCYVWQDGYGWRYQPN